MKRLKLLILAVTVQTVIFGSSASAVIFADTQPPAGTPVTVSIDGSKPVRISA